ncbi:hypothetical protein OTK49_00195 [Vibrio coralliirubri]|uniref:hypothetical protein n=1 Tax=Vibrio coralliirubri TaxID=1516159 RepID=UPI0022847049|nr:hypothetical protein [Vibrio coralliirubri]MCY9860960.1 hypothetical protein [Vibrio coralliirubri]
MKINLNSYSVEIMMAAVLFCAVLMNDANAAEDKQFTEAEIAQVESGNSVYEDKIDISYLSKMVIHPQDDWIGKKVFKYNGVCMEVVKDLKIKKIKDPFKNLYRSANLPKEIEIGDMNVESQVVDCSLYESKVTVFE